MSALRWFMPVSCLLLAETASAQQGLPGDPHVGYIYPAGGRQGATFQATIGGRYLNATSVHFSGKGVRATIVRQDRQVTPQEQQTLVQMITAIQEKRRGGQAITREEMQQAEEVRHKLDQFGRRLTNPALGEFITIEVSIAPDAAMGIRELRLGTVGGHSNPLVFHVGGLPEVSKPDWKNIPKEKASMEARIDPKPPEKRIALPVVLNGQIPPGGHDRYRFAARKDQQLVVAVRARELIPFISDAVPGWFKASVWITDAAGEELCSSDDRQFLSDPALAFQAPADGEYVLHIKDALYRGREDFVYRITIGELPLVDAVFPLGGRTGTTLLLDVTGQNLPFKRLTLDLKDRAAGVCPLALSGIVNRVSVAADPLPEGGEKEPNNDIASAQAVKLPLVINGRIDRPGDVDTYRFEGKAGDRIVADVIARRLDSPLDSFLLITDATGKQVAFNDDREDRSAGLGTHHADSYLAFTLPSAGPWFIHLGDMQQDGGPAHGYRVRLGAPRPDFELRATPSALNVRGGASVPVTVHALRKDGFAGAIELRLNGAPEGITLSGARIAANQDSVRFTLNAVPSARLDPFNIRIEGRAIVDGREVVRPALPADDVMQAFAYRHLVPAQEQKLSIVGRYRPGVGAKILSSTPLRIPAGGTVPIRVFMPAGPIINRIDFELSQPPMGVTIKATDAGDGQGTEIVLQSDRAQSNVGTRGNLIITASVPAPVETGRNPGGVARRIPLGALPAIPFEIVAR
ncbi:MAG: hypothetical protein FJ221_08805 [Lentisphaerae bacterium]|nr:hypothetical protein [Lentisphaerota bacterium]